MQRKSCVPGSGQSAPWRLKSPPKLAIAGGENCCFSEYPSSPTLQPADASYSTDARDVPDEQVIATTTIARRRGVVNTGHSSTGAAAA